MALVYRYCDLAAAAGGNGESWATAWNLDGLIANGGGGVHCYMRGSTTRTASDTFPAGTIGSKFVIEGCGTVAGDGYLGRNETTGELIDTNMPVINYSGGDYFITFAKFTNIFNIKFTASARAGAVVVGTTASEIYNCIVINAHTNTSAGGIISFAQAHNCDVKLTGTGNNGAGIDSGSLCTDCRVWRSGTNTTSSGISGSGTIDGCIIYPSAGLGIDCNSSSAVISNCTVHGQNIGIRTRNAANTTTTYRIFDTIISGCGYAYYNRYGATEAHSFSLYNNLYYDNDNFGFGMGDYYDFSSETTLTDPYVNSATNDLRLARTSAATNAGTGGTSDIGGLQRIAVWPVATDLKKDVVVDGITGLYDPITGQYTDPGKANVVVGNDYTFAGVSQVAEHPTAATSEATGAAAQLVIDKAAVSAEAENIIIGTTILTIAGEHPTAATSEASGAAAQLIIDTAEVESKKASILDSETILGVGGTYPGNDPDTVIDTAGGNWQTPANADVRKDVPNGIAPSVGTMPYPTIDSDLPDVAEIIRDWLCSSPPVVARLARYDFGDGAQRPAIFTRDPAPEECKAPLATIAIGAGASIGNRDHGDFEQGARVTIWGERRGSAKEARLAAAAIHEALKRGAPAIDGYAIHIYSDPPGDVSDADGYPGFAMNTRVQIRKEN